MGAFLLLGVGGVFCRVIKGFDSQMLFDAFEDQLYLPTLLVQRRKTASVPIKLTLHQYKAAFH